MDKAIVLAVAASVCTAASSVCQRMGAKGIQARGFDVGLMVRLARRPVWLLGIASMIGGLFSSSPRCASVTCRWSSLSWRPSWCSCSAT